jgi:hypothetical protein
MKLSPIVCTNIRASTLASKDNLLSMLVPISTVAQWFRHMLLAVVLLGSSSFPAHSQSEWTYLESFQSANAWTRDVIELPDGYLLAATVRDGIPGSDGAVIRRLSTAGQLLTGTTLPTIGTLPNVCCITTSSIAEHFTAYGVLIQPDGVPAFFRQPFVGDLSSLTGSLFPVPGRSRLFMENIIRTSTDEVLLMAGGEPGTTAPLEGYLVQIDPIGAEIGRTHLLSNNGIAVIPLHGFHDSTSGYLLASLGSILGSGFYRRSQFMWVNQELNVIQHFHPQEPEPPLTGNHLTISDSPCAVSLPSGDIVVSGTFGSLTSGTNCLLLRMNGNGDTLAYFLPPQGSSSDHTAALEALSMDDDGNLLYCQMENLQVSFNQQTNEVTPLEPTEPSRVRIMRLDTSFNVLCEQVIDGFAEDAYYLPTRIKPTSDGGYVVIGTRRVVNATERAMMWAAKFPNSACVNAISEIPTVLEHRVFPNPGTDGFTLLISGPSIARATIELLDALGRIVGAAPLYDSKGWIPTDQLAPGVYHYQVVDTQRTVLAQGKWVHE